MGILILFIIMGLIVLAGFNFSLLIKKNHLPWGERLVLGWVMGLPLMTYGLFLIGAAGIRIGRVSIFLTAFILALGLLLFRKLRKITCRFPAVSGHFDLLSFALLVVLILVVAASGLIGLYWPFHTADGRYIWAVKGMAIVTTGDLSAVEYGSLPFYPLHIPLGIGLAFAYLPSLSGLIFWLNFLFCLGLFFYNLRAYLDRGAALFFTLFLATVPYFFDHSTRAYADLTLALYFGGATFYLLRFIWSGESGFFWLSAWLTGMAIWTKSEGWFLLAINLPVLLFFLKKANRRLRLLWWYFGLGLLWGLPWNLYSVYLLGFKNPGFGWVFITVKEIMSGHLRLGRLDGIIVYLLEKAFRSAEWGWLGGSLVLVSVLRFKRLKESGYLAAIIFLHIFLLICVYYGNPLSFSRIMHQTIKRQFLHLLPLLVFYLALLAGPDFGSLVRRGKSFFRRG